MLQPDLGRHVPSEPDPDLVRRGRHRVVLGQGESGMDLEQVPSLPLLRPNLLGRLFR